MRRIGLRFAITGLAVLGVGCSLLASASASDDQNPTKPPTTPTATVTDGSPEAIVLTSPDGSRHEIHRSGPKNKGRWECHYLPVGGTNVYDFNIQYNSPPITPEPGQLVGLVCIDEAGGYAYRELFVYNPANPFGPLQLPERAADEARRQLIIDPPAVAMSPPATTAQLVGLDTWFWITDPWQPLQASATLDGVTSTVVATPTSLTFTLDDGTTFACDGPGTPYNTLLDPTGQQSTCTHTFQHAGTNHITTTVTYTVHWTATTAPGGDLENLTRTTTTPITIQQAQALIR